MAVAVDIGTLIVRTPEMRGGRPRIAGTGVTVRRIVGWYKLGWSPEEITDRIGHLSEDVEVWRAARQVVQTVYALSREPGLARDVGL